MEPLSSMLWVFALVLMMISWGLLIQISFATDFSWGLCSVLLPPLAYLCGLLYWQKAREPILMSLLAWLLIFLAAG